MGSGRKKERYIPLATDPARRFLRMPFGITYASEVFQRAMEEPFAGHPCAIIVDGLLVWDEGTADHEANLKKVLQRVREISTPHLSYLSVNGKLCDLKLTKGTRK